MQTFHQRCVGKSFTNLLGAEDDLTKGVYLCGGFTADRHSASLGLK